MNKHILNGFLATSLELAVTDDNTPDGVSESARKTAQNVVREFIKRARISDVMQYAANIRWNSDSPNARYGNIGSDLALEYFGAGVGFEDRNEVPERTRKRLSDVATGMQSYVSPVIGDDGLVIFE